MGLTPTQASTLLEANVMNLAKKVAKGETLSPKELALVQAKANGGDTRAMAKNQVELADILGVNRKTVQRWLKIEGNPGHKANGSYDVAAWRTFAAGRGHEDVGDLDQVQLRAENLLLSNELLREKIAQFRGEYVPKVQLIEWGGELGAAIRKVVTQMHMAAQSLAGLSVPEIEARLKEMEDEILRQLNMLEEHIHENQAPTAKDGEA